MITRTWYMVTRETPGVSSRVMEAPEFTTLSTARQWADAYAATHQETTQVIRVDEPVAMPTDNDLDQWPYVDGDSPLWTLGYAEQVSDALVAVDDYQYPLWHETMGWLFDICTAHYALAIQHENGHEILDHLDRMKFRMSPLFRGADDLEDDTREVFDFLVQKYGQE